MCDTCRDVECGLERMLESMEWENNTEPDKLTSEDFFHYFDKVYDGLWGNA